jgi:hypothetical protein
MYILLLTRVTEKGYTQHTTANELDGSLRQFKNPEKAEKQGTELLNTKGNRIVWFDVKRIY